MMNPFGKPKHGHVDEFIDDYKSDAYASFVLFLSRLPASQTIRWSQFFSKLFCDHDGSRWRVTGASRLGDVWLAKDPNRDHGYDKRVQIDTCSNWGPK